ncbi:MAG: hypothetical protein ACR2HV_04845 [Acidimicrobiales bacterium]
MKYLAEHNVVATFPDMDTARGAVEALARAGIEAEDISLLGRAVEEARNDADTKLRDMEATGEIAKRAGAGAAAGTALGALAGLAAFAIPGVGPVIGAGTLAAVIGGGVAGTAVGGMVGGVAGISLEDDWDLTFNESIRAGSVLVAVHASDKADVDKAAEVFEKEDADQVEWLGPDGRRLDDDGTGGSDGDGDGAGGRGSGGSGAQDEGGAGREA